MLTISLRSLMRRCGARALLALTLLGLALLVARFIGAPRSPKPAPRTAAQPAREAAATPTRRSLLTEVQQFGADAVLDAAGGVTNEATAASHPPERLRYHSQDPHSETPAASHRTMHLPAAGPGTRTAAQPPIGWRMKRSLFEADPDSYDPSLSHFEMELNGDGRPDHVVLQIDNVTRTEPITIQPYLTRPDGSYAPLPALRIPWSRDWDLPLGASVADISGDGREELLLTPRRRAPSPHFAYITVSFDPLQERLVANTEFDGLPGWSFRGRLLGGLFSEDFSGDGRADLVAPLQDGDTFTLYAARGTGAGTFTELRPTRTPWQVSRINPDRGMEVAGLLLSLDVNGDGRTDLVRLSANKLDGDHLPAAGATLLICVALSRTPASDGFRDAPFTLAPCTETNIPVSKGEPGDLLRGDWFLPADLNGDGATDLARVTFDTGGVPHEVLQALLSDGNGGFRVLAEEPTDIPLLGDRGQAGYEPWRVADINNDRRDDLVVLRLDREERTEIIRVRSVGIRGTADVTFRVERELTAIPYPRPSVPWPRGDAMGRIHSFATVDVNDHNGDGQTDVVVWFRSGHVGWDDDVPCGGFGCKQYEVQWTPYVHLGGYDQLDVPAWKSLDVDGDGRPDYIHLSDRRDDLRVETRLRQPDGSFRDGLVYRFAFGVPSLQPDHFRVTDLDGDGKQDLVLPRFEYAPAGGAPYRVRFLALKSAGPGAWGSLSTVLPADIPMADLDRWFVMDADADGRRDLVYLSYEANDDPACLGRQTIRLDAFLSTGDGFAPARTTRGLSGCLAAPGARAWRVADVDLDGADDLVGAFWHWTGPQAAVVTLRADRRGGFTAAAWSPGALPAAHHPGAWMVVDQNGDGLPDLLALGMTVAAGKNDLRTDLLLSHGDGSYAPLSPLSLAGLDTPNLHAWLPADRNGDGRSDLVRLGASAGGDLTVATFHADQPAAGLRLVADTPATIPSYAPLPDVHAYGALDLDGEGWSELEALWPGGGGIEVRRLKWAPALDLIASMRSPGGAETRVSYEEAQLAGSLNAPGCRLPPGGAPPNVAAVVIDPQSGDPAITQRFGYECPTWSFAENQGFGWKRVTAYDEGMQGRPAQNELSEYDVTDACGSLLGMRTLWGGGASQVVRVDNPTPAGAPPYRCEPLGRTRIDTDARGGARTISERYEYDEFGAVAWLFEAGTPVGGDEYTTRTRRAIDDGTFLVTLAESAIYEGPDDTGPRLRASRACYDQPLAAGCVDHALSRGLLTAELRWDGEKARWIATEFAYDAFGNQTAVTDARGHVSSTEFDGVYHLYPVLARNALRHETRTGWDTRLGLATFQIDPNGVRQNLRGYDPLGRLRRLENAAGAVTEHRYRDLRDAGVRNAEIETIVWDGPTALDSKVVLDGLGRTTTATRKGDGVRRYRQDISFGDLSSNPVRRSLWYEGAGPGQIERLHYDFLGRPEGVTHPDGAAATVEHLADSLIETDEAGHEVRRHFDAYGHLARLEEPHEGRWVTTTYVHDRLGQLRGVRDPAGNESGWRYDTLGRPARHVDPDLGSRRFEYDDTGNLTVRRDGRATIEIDYDALGRPSRKRNSLNARLTEWSYDEPGHAGGIGRLTSVRDSVAPGCAQAMSVDYDVFGHPGSTTRCMDGRTRRLVRDYDALGRLHRLRYPDGEEVTYQYDDGGQLAAVTPYVARLSYDAAGHLRRAELGNGTVEERGYSPEREWLDSTEVRDRAGASVYRATYTHEPDALPRSADTLTLGRVHAQRYDHDAQHRLTAARGSRPESFAYDDIGNMRANGGLSGGGAYRYPKYGAGEKRVHAAMQAGDLTFRYDETGNLTEAARAGAGERTYAWDEEAHPTEVRVNHPRLGWRATTYVYDAAGERVRRTDPAGESTYYFFPEVEEDGAGRLAKSYFAAGRLIARQAGGQVTYYHADRQDSTRLLTDSKGDAVAGSDFEYSAFGLRTGGSAAASALYIGERQDGDTAVEEGAGLLYLHARYYDPETARFLSPDPVLPGRQSLLSLNRYAYGYQSPILYSDPSGLDPGAFRAVVRGEGWRGSLGDLWGSGVGRMRWEGWALRQLMRTGAWRPWLGSHLTPQNPLEARRYRPLLSGGQSLWGEVSRVGNLTFGVLALGRLPFMLAPTLGPEALSGGFAAGASEAMAADGASTTLYRAVGDGEFQDVLRHGDYGLSPHLGGKYFTFTEMDARIFAESSLNAGRQMTITSMEVPTSFLEKGFRFYDKAGGGSSIHFADDILIEMYQRAGMVRIIDAPWVPWIRGR